eukprot:1728862-Pleurochrysis_carterae.AAC.1
MHLNCDVCAVADRCQEVVQPGRSAAPSLTALRASAPTVAAVRYDYQSQREGSSACSTFALHIYTFPNPRYVRTNTHTALQCGGASSKRYKA